MNALPPNRLGYATARDWARFLKPLVGAVAQPPLEHEFLAKVAAIGFALHEVPADLLTEWRQREAMARFKFFPVPAELAEWLAPALAARRDTAARASALAAPQPPKRTEPSADEIAQVRAAAQSFLADMAGRIGPGRVEVQARCLSGEALRVERLKVGAKPIAPQPEPAA